MLVTNIFEREKYLKTRKAGYKKKINRQSDINSELFHFANKHKDVLQLRVPC